VDDDGEGERKARDLFFSEARRRVLSMLCDLRTFAGTFNVWPPSWTFDRLAELGQLVINDAPGVAAASVEDSIAAVEVEIRQALAELASSIEARPIPYALVEPLEAPPPRRLGILRGGRA
jgi:hypothetical protein